MHDSTFESRGFTLVELMIVTVVLGILVAIALPNFVSMKSRAVDASMKCDLHGAMVVLEDYKIQFSQYPSDAATFQNATGFDLSPDVTWDRFELQLKNGVMSVHMHLAHPRSSNKWHAHYPAEGSNIEVR